MITYLKGNIIEVHENSINLLINKCVGYEIFTRASWHVNQEIEIYIYHHFGSDTQTLFGFQSLSEKALFLKLISLSKIGPKTALNILALGMQDILQAFANNDVKFLQKAKGLGKKNAERLILEFGNGALEDILFQKSSGSTENQDVIYALSELGYRDKTIKDFLNKKPEHISDTASIIKYFLQNINN